MKVKENSAQQTVILYKNQKKTKTKKKNFAEIYYFNKSKYLSESKVYHISIHTRTIQYMN